MGVYKGNVYDQYYVDAVYQGVDLLRFTGGSRINFGNLCGQK